MKSVRSILGACAAAGAIIVLLGGPATASSRPSYRDVARGDQPNVQTLVTLAFDDAYADQYTIRSALAAHGMHATFYLNSGPVGVSSSAMTWQEVNDMAADGNEIAGHTVLHPDLMALPEDEQRREICNDRTSLLDRGFQVTSFAYPFGSADNLTRSIVQQCGYNTARGSGGAVTAGGPYAETIPPQNPYALSTPPGVASSWTLADIEGWVTRAEQHGGGWVELRFHHVCTGCDPLSVTQSNFTALLDWLAPRAASGTLVRTNYEVWGGDVQPGVPGPPPPPATTIVNPSLESDANVDEIPDCWSQLGYGSNTATWTRTNDAHSGSFAEQLRISGYQNGARHLLTKLDLGACTPTAYPGMTYDLSGWYKSTVATRFFVYYRNGQGGFPFWMSSPQFAAASSWTQATWRTPALPAGATGIAFGLSLASNGTLTTDDFSISPTTPTSVRLVSFVATKQAKRLVTIRWRAGPGAVALGFNLYRAEKTKLNRALILARGQAAGASYTWVDRLPKTLRSTPCYRLGAVAMDGARVFLGRTCAL